MKAKWISVFFALAFVPSSVMAGDNICIDSNGKYQAPQCTATGEMEVDVKDITPGTGATDLGKAEDAAFANGDTIVGGGYVRRDTAAAMTSANGDWGTAVVSEYGAQLIEIDKAFQKSTATGLLKAEDAAHTTADAGVMSFSVRADNAASTAGADGDYAAFLTDALGKLWITGTFAEDVASAGGDNGIAAMAVRDDALAANAGVTLDGDYMPLRGDNLGALWTNPLGSTTTVCVAITPDDDAAYTADDVVATEDATDPLTFAGVFRTSLNSGILNSIQITNTEPDAVGWRVVIFDADPSTSTTTDGSALTVADADLTKIVGQVSVSDCTSYADNELCQATGVNLAIDGAATGLYVALITPGVPQWAAAQTVNVCLTVVQD